MAREQGEGRTAMVLELLILLAWMAVATVACWLVWRAAYAQGRGDAQFKPCCSGGGGHEGPAIPMPSPDEWDATIERILAGRD